MFKEIENLTRKLNGLIDDPQPGLFTWCEFLNNNIGQLNKLFRKENTYLVGTHRYSFRSGKPAQIIGLEFNTPKGLDKRLTYRIKFPDGVEDLVAVKDHAFFEIISESDLNNNKIPPVTH